MNSKELKVRDAIKWLKDNPQYWDFTVRTEDIYRSKFVQQIETQEHATKVNKHQRLSGTYKFSKLCKMALERKTDNWVPTTFARGAGRRAQLCLNLIMAYDRLPLTKTSPMLYNYSLEVLETNIREIYKFMPTSNNIRALKDRGTVSGYISAKVPKYPAEVHIYQNENYRRIISNECREPAEYSFFCSYFSYPFLGEGNRSVYSTFVASSVALAFFKSDQSTGSQFIEAKKESQDEILEMFATLGGLT